jgi:hypothetical protein
MTNLVDIVSSRMKAELLRPLFGLNLPELHLRGPDGHGPSTTRKKAVGDPSRAGGWE